jgi:hypothetical protein
VPVLGCPPFIKVAPGKTDNLLGASVEGVTTPVEMGPILASLALYSNQPLFIQQIQIDRQSSA